MAGRGAYSRRPRRNWRPNERQRQVLDLLVEGKTNAELAARLGITLDGAKWHVGELLAQTRCEDRQALVRWWRQRREGRATAWIIPAFVTLRPALLLLPLLAAGVALILVVGKDNGAPDLPGVVLSTTVAERPSVLSYTPVVAPTATPWPEDAVEALAKQDEPPSSCEPPERQDLRIVSADELRAQGLVDLGRVVFVGHCPLYVANRADRAVVWMGGGGYVKADFSRGRGVGPCCSYGDFYLEDQRYALKPRCPNLLDGLFWRDPDLVKFQKMA
jgi:DNA-binding CsgD family transcriptional regulator